MGNPFGTFYQDHSQVTALRAIAPVVRVEGKLTVQLKPVEVCRSFSDGMETALCEVAGRIEAIKDWCQPNRQVTITQVISADPVSQARIEWELFRGVIASGTGEVSSSREGVELLAENSWAVADRIARRVRLVLQSSGEKLNLDRTNVAQAQLKKRLKEDSGSVVLPWIHPDLWPGDVVERIDGRVLNLGRDRVVRDVVMRFGSQWTTTLMFGGAT